jgi:hypothetical protein
MVNSEKRQLLEVATPEPFAKVVPGRRQLRPVSYISATAHLGNTVMTFGRDPSAILAACSCCVSQIGLQT